MKTYILVALLTVLGSHLATAQNDIHNITTIEDGVSYQLHIVDGELIEFKMDGEEVPVREYHEHAHVLDQYVDLNAGAYVAKRSTRKYSYHAPQPPTPRTDHDTSDNDILASALEKKLLEKELIISASKYKLKLSNDILKVNGTKYPHYHNELYDFLRMHLALETDEKVVVSISKRKGSNSINVSVTSL